MRVKVGDITKIKTGKLDANAASEDGEYPFFTCSREPLRISSYSYDCECVLVAGNGDLNVKYYNGKFDAYQRTYIIEDNSDGKLYMPYLYPSKYPNSPSQKMKIHHTLYLFPHCKYFLLNAPSLITLSRCL